MTTGNQNGFECSFCRNTYTTKGGKTRHQNKCAQNPENRTEPTEVVTLSTENQTDVTNIDPPNPLIPPNIIEPDPPPDHHLVEPAPPPSYIWNGIPSNVFEVLIHAAYEKVVYWRKNVFLLPTGKAGKSFIDETRRLLDEWVQDSPLKSIAFTAIMVMPSLLLQKPSKTSKAKDHAGALERRLLLWRQGDIEELVREGETIQKQLPDALRPKQIGKISRKFAKLMTRGKVNSAMRLLTNNMKNGILPLTDETLAILRQKHPKSTEPDPYVLLADERPQQIHPVFFDQINVETIRNAALRTNGGSGPSNLDSEGWRRMLLSNSFGDSSESLCQSISRVARKMCTERSDSIDAFLACRLIPLDKNPGLRPIGVGEVLRRIIGKAVMSTTKEHVKKSVGSLQVCAGQEAGCEAAIHAMKDIFQQEDTEAVLLIDAANAFNSINRKAFVHNVCIICPEISMYVENCYNKPSRLFVIGGVEVSSTEGTTQGDPIAMAVYAIAAIPLLLMVLEITDNLPGVRTKSEAYADDFSAAGSLQNLLKWWTALCRLGPKFGYHPEPRKSWLIVKPTHLASAEQIFSSTEINITTEGKRHLGASIGSSEYRDHYVNEKIDNICQELHLLSEIGKIEPHAAYAGFTSGFRHKLTFIMRTIPDISVHLRRIDQIILHEFIPSITGGIQVNEVERKLISLPTKYGGLGIPIFEDQSPIEYSNSRSITSHLCDAIKSQTREFVPDPNLNKKKSAIRKQKLDNIKSTLQRLDTLLNVDQKRLLSLNQEHGASSWLSTLPLESEGYHLSKQCFQDLLRIRYGWPLPRTPTTCECGSLFSLDHALSCKKGGFISLRHNKLRNFLAKSMKEVCHDVQIEPPLQTLVGVENLPKSSVKSDEARLDVSARGFWVTGQKAFFDIRVFNPLAKRYVSLEPQRCYTLNEVEKKRHYNNRVIEVEHGSLTPMVFSATGGYGRECGKAIRRLASMLSEKKHSRYSETMSWLTRKINFSLIKSIHLCFRGSRSVSPLRTTEQDIVFCPSVTESFSRINL